MSAPTLAGDLQKVRRDLDSTRDALETVAVDLVANRDALDTGVYDAIEALTRAVSTLALAVEREARQA